MSPAQARVPALARPQNSLAAYDQPMADYLLPAQVKTGFVQRTYYWDAEFGAFTEFLIACDAPVPCRK